MARPFDHAQQQEIHRDPLSVYIYISFNGIHTLLLCVTRGYGYPLSVYIRCLESSSSSSSFHTIPPPMELQSDGRVVISYHGYTMHILMWNSRLISAHAVLKRPEPPTGHPKFCDTTIQTALRGYQSRCASKATPEFHTFCE